MAIFRLCLRLVLNHQTDNSKVLKEWPAIMALQSKPDIDTNVNLNDIPEITVLARIGMINDENLLKEIFSRVCLLLLHSINFPVYSDKDIYSSW